MTLVKILRPVLLAVSLLSVATPFLSAQSAGDWADVMRLSPGTKVQVQTKLRPGENVRGKLQSTTDADLTLVDRSGAVRVYQRADVARVRLRRSDAAPLAGAVAGAAWGGLVAGISDGGAGQKAAAVATVAAVGWLIGKAIQKGAWKTIYEAVP